MSERERLIEILNSTVAYENEDTGDYIEWLADELLEKDVIVLPVKMGDTVYEVQQDGTIQMWYVYGIIKYDGQEWTVKAKNNKNKWRYIDKTFAFRLFGKTVFITRKEALKALKGGAINENNPDNI